jgi:hypothetical protein
MLEHIICSSIMEHLDRHKILYDAQHGFRKQRSCGSQLILTIQDYTGHCLGAHQHGQEQWLISLLPQELAVSAFKEVGYPLVSAISDTIVVNLV